MIDRKMISNRFFSCYQGMSRSAIAHIYGVQRTTVTEWATNGAVPWCRLKYLSDSQSISWSWLFDGIGPIRSMKKACVLQSTMPAFDRVQIAQRFLSLFTNMNQTAIAAELAVTSSTVSEWRRGKGPVPWEKLAYGVERFGVSWDWLLDGLEPKYRE